MRHLGQIDGAVPLPSRCQHLNNERSSIRLENSLHVAYIKKAGLFSSPSMAFSYAEVGILYWH